MPVKRPDQLPEGEDFNFEDILMVEKSPDSNERKLYKTKLREFMESALKMDPERIGSNAVLGLQSKFEWLIEQMDKISQSPVLDIEPYSIYESETKNQEYLYITPTPSPTPSITPTPSPSGFIQPPTPSSTPTPTPTPKADQKELQITVRGRQNIVVPIPEQYKPYQHGYTNWVIKNGENTSNTYSNYFGLYPDSFQPTALGEKLLSLYRVDNSHIRIEVGLVNQIGLVTSTQGLIEGSQISFTLIYN